MPEASTLGEATASSDIYLQVALTSLWALLPSSQPEEAVHQSLCSPLGRSRPVMEGLAHPPAPRVLRATDLSAGSGSGLQLPLGQGSLNLE